LSHTFVIRAIHSHLTTLLCIEVSALYKPFYEKRGKAPFFGTPDLCVFALDALHKLPGAILLSPFGRKRLQANRAETHKRQKRQKDSSFVAFLVVFR
jgi:hypothetical protein